MDEENLENETPTNEGEQDTIPETELENKTAEELVKAKEIAENQKIRAEKAEAELKRLKQEKQTPKNQLETETPKNDEKSNEPDYAKLAWLNSNKVEHPDDQKIVMDEAKRLKLPLTDVLNMEHIKSKLKDASDQREAETGAPKGKGKSGGSSSQDVEYHLAKGTTPDDLELAEKVIDARMKQETNANKFSDELFTG